MDRDTIIRLAREAGWNGIYSKPLMSIRMQEEDFLRFAALVAAAEREKVARWMMERGYATGHGDTTEDLLQDLDWQIAENWNRALINGITTEREACAKVCETYDHADPLGVSTDCAAAIRAKGETK